MTRRLATSAERAEGWALGEFCQLESPCGNDGVIKVSKVDLDSDEIQQHLEGGRICSALSIARTGQLAMQLQDDLALKKIKFDDALLEQADSGDDEASRFDADAHILIPALAAVAEELISLLGVKLSHRWRMLLKTQFRHLKQPEPSPYPAFGLALSRPFLCAR